MSRDLENELREMFESVTGRETGDCGPGDDLVAALGVDSLTGLRFLAHTEKKYDVRFPDEQLSGFRTLASIARFIEKGQP
ncbi:MAG: acyl carrier protein [Verrucomicrobia bacterium]|nr:acyl carrier protein [Verrucomicrobiota bacterium]MDA1088225.1 acyl carrier protein [Verrucomicrobiota bacterium]